MIEWHEMSIDQQLAEMGPPTECECEKREGTHTLVVEEGQASVLHDACGLPLWFLPEDTFAEFPVTVKVEDCGNPGGWHGDIRCERGPTITIEYDAARDRR